jgi:ribonuclease Z
LIPVLKKITAEWQIREAAPHGVKLHGQKMVDLIFLGTGSATPTSHRNLSGTALLRQGEIFLFDCGEGTQVQFRRAGLKPGKLRYIFISHFHGDHLFGLPGLLTSLQMANLRQEVHLFGPKGIAAYIRFHQTLCGFGFDFVLHIHEIEPNSPEIIWQAPDYRIAWQPLQHRIFTLGFALIEAPRPGKFDAQRAEALGVPHGPERGRLQSGESIVLANGTQIHSEQVLGPPRPGVKIAYCVDTSPCAGQERLAQNADALIADSTFPASEQEWAHQTGHSTAKDAAETAQRCGVRQLFLTHFSGAIGPTEFPLLQEEAAAIFPDTIAATDLARFKILPRQ